ncbi:CDP-diacylglycerol--glycerol-3-phosphate 3-phosphatidyltransferase [bacterium]|nr:CDP-diacylglycerol--glycerol-3-phosphate 3-phosphatidyltransferase [bacterium]
MNLPTQLTLLRILLTPVFVLFLFFGGPVSRIISFIVFTVAALTDWYDGYTARKFCNVSMWGKFLDPLADKILVSSGFICFSVMGYIPAWMVLIIVVRDFFITGLRSYAVIKGMPIVTSLIAKTKTFCQFGAIYIIFIYHLFTGGRYDDVWIVFRRIHEMNLIYAMMVIITFLTLLSGFFYLTGNRSHLKQMASDFYHIFAPSDI